MKKLSFHIASLLIIYVSPSIASPLYCKIIYGEKYLDHEIRNSDQLMIKENISLIKGKKHCKRIGLEHDKEKNPIKENPIFACCNSKLEGTS
tara:strand:- start:155 stop:430 length:276 start_codon:yes stop_codon:yes gene_type:complete